MINDTLLHIIGVEHIPTKNNVTVRARIFMKDQLTGKVYSFDADTFVFEMDTEYKSKAKSGGYGVINIGDRQ